MSDLIEQEESGQNPDVDATVLQKQVSELSSKLEQVSKAKSGVDKTYAELQREYQELKKANMTESERIQAERDEYKNKVAELERATHMATLKEKALTMLYTEGLSPQAVKYVLADSEDAIAENIKQYKADIDAAVKAKVESEFKSAGRSVTPSETPNDLSDEEYMKRYMSELTK